MDVIWRRSDLELTVEIGVTKTCKNTVMEDFSKSDVFLFLENRYYGNFSLPINSVEQGVLKSTFSVPELNLSAGIYNLKLIWCKNGIAWDKEQMIHHHHIAAGHIGHLRGSCMPDLYECHEGREAGWKRQDISVLEITNAFALTDDKNSATYTKSTARMVWRREFSSYGYDGLDAWQRAILLGLTNMNEVDWLNSFVNTQTLKARMDRLEGIIKELHPTVNIDDNPLSSASIPDIEESYTEAKQFSISRINTVLTGDVKTGSGKLMLTCVTDSTFSLLASNFDVSEIVDFDTPVTVNLDWNKVYKFTLTYKDMQGNEYTYVIKQVTITDTLSSTEYDYPVVTFEMDRTSVTAAENHVPVKTISYKQTKTLRYASGRQSTENITSGLTVEYYMKSTIVGVGVSEDGTVNFIPNNSTENTRVATVCCRVTGLGTARITTKEVTITQAAKQNPYKIYWGTRGTSIATEPLTSAEVEAKTTNTEFTASDIPYPLKVTGEVKCKWIAVTHGLTVSCKDDSNVMVTDALKTSTYTTSDGTLLDVYYIFTAIASGTEYTFTINN